MESRIRRVCNFVTILVATFLIVLVVSKAKAEDDAKVTLLLAFCLADSPGIADVMNAVAVEDKQLYVKTMRDAESGCFDLRLLGADQPLIAWVVRNESTITRNDGLIVQFLRVKDNDGTELITWNPAGRAG